MKSHYRPIGDFIRLIDERNIGLRVKNLVGLSISKQFIPSVANTIGTDMENYKIIRKDQFACSVMQVRRDKKMPAALWTDDEDAIISQAYPVFEIIDKDELLPEYLMMWFSRSEFDREACFYAVGGVRGSLEWEDFCSMKLPIPSPDKQREIVREYNTIVNRIKLNEQLCLKLEETAQAIYKQWFVDFEFPDETGNPYKGSGGEMVYNEDLRQEIPKRWEIKQLHSVCSKIGSGATPQGGRENYHKSGISLIRSLNVYDYRFSLDELAFIDLNQAKGLSNVIVEEGDVLLNITGVSVARCCIVPSFILPARVNQHVIIIRPGRQQFLSYYLLCLLCYSDNKARLLGISQSGSTREAITKTEVEEFSFLKPGTDVLRLFDIKMKVIFKFIENKLQEKQKLYELENTLLSKLATLDELAYEVH